MSFSANGRTVVGQRYNPFCPLFLTPGAFQMEDDRILTDNVIAVGKEVLVAARAQIAACEKCSPDAAEILIETVLDEITGSNPAQTTYLFTEPIQCPKCGEAITENSLVEWDGGIEVETT